MISFLLIATETRIERKKWTKNFCSHRNRKLDIIREIRANDALEYIQSI